MKSRIGLAISIGLNLGLAGVLAWLWFSLPRNSAAGSSSSFTLDRGTNADGESKEIQLAYPSRPNFKFPTNILSHITWRSIESTDYRKYIDNLHAIKCPEKTIEDIIVADINDLYIEKWKALLEADAEAFKYWQTGDQLPGFPTDAAELRAEAFDQARRELIQELLGVTVEDSIVQLGAIDPMELTLNFVPAERRREVIAAQEQFARDQTALLSDVENFENIEVRLRALRDRYDAQLDELLTPEERRRFEMTTSPLAMALRMELAGFEPTEEEFRQIYEARKQMEEDIELAQAAVTVMAVEELREQQRMDAELKQEVAMQAALLEQLGPERYAQYQRTMDPTYQTLMQSSIVNLVRPEVANRMYELQQVANVEAEKVRANTDFTLDQRDAALVGIQVETERTIRENLGANAFHAYEIWRQESAR